MAKWTINSQLAAWLDWLEQAQQLAEFGQNNALSPSASPQVRPQKTAPRRQVSLQHRSGHAANSRSA